MAMKVKTNRIVLSGQAAKQFNKLAKSPDPEVAEKRDKFYKEINKTIDVQKRDKTIRIIVKG